MLGQKLEGDGTAELRVLGPVRDPSVSRLSRTTSRWERVRREQKGPLPLEARLERAKGNLHHGRELFYLRGDRMLMATPFDSRTGRPRALFHTTARSFSRACCDVAPDGRFLFLLDEGALPPLLIVRDRTALLEPSER